MCSLSHDLMNGGEENHPILGYMLLGDTKGCFLQRPAENAGQKSSFLRNRMEKVKRTLVI